MSVLEQESQSVTNYLRTHGLTYSLDQDTECWYQRSTCGLYFVPAVDIVRDILDTCRPKHMKPGLFRRLVKSTLATASLDIEFTCHLSHQPHQELNTTAGVLDLTDGTLRDLSQSDRFTYVVPCDEGRVCTGGSEEVLEAIRGALQTPTILMLTGKHASAWVEALSEMHPVVALNDHQDVRAALHGLSDELHHLRLLACPHASPESQVRLSRQWNAGPCFSMAFANNGLRVLLPVAADAELVVVPVNQMPPLCLVSALRDTSSPADSHVIEYRRRLWTGSAVQQFVDQCCVVGEGLAVRSSQLYRAFDDYCHEAGIHCDSNQQVYTALESAGFGLDREEYVLHGLRLRQPEETI